MDKNKILEGLQIIVTDLAQQADGHAIQSRVFYSQGFDKLGEKYAEHASEERGYVDQCIDRILDLGGEVKLDALVEKAKEDFKAAHKRTPIVSLKMYLKPEDNAVYYVINETSAGKVDL